MYQFFLHFFIYCGLYNKPSYARGLIGSHLWSIGGQTYRIYSTIIPYIWYNNWAMTSCHLNSYIDPSLKFIEQIDSKLPCICSVIDHRGRQNVVRTSVTHSAAPCVPLFFYIVPLWFWLIVWDEFLMRVLDWNVKTINQWQIAWTKLWKLLELTFAGTLVGELVELPWAELMWI